MEPENSLPQTVSILSQINPFHPAASHFLKNHFNLILLSTSRSSKWPLFLTSPHQNFVCTSSASHTFQILCTYHYSWFGHPWKRWRRENKTSFPVSTQVPVLSFSPITTVMARIVSRNSWIRSVPALNSVPLSLFPFNKILVNLCVERVLLWDAVNVVWYDCKTRTYRIFSTFVLWFKLHKYFNSV